MFDKEKVIFHQDNACLHTSVIAMAKIHGLRYELLLHSPYSPDLAPLHFYLFPKLKIFLGGWRFSTMEELTVKVEGYFAAEGISFFGMGSRHGPNAFVYRETMLKNKNSSTEVRHFFLVHSKNFSNHPHISILVCRIRAREYRQHHNQCYQHIPISLTQFYFFFFLF